MELFAIFGVQLSVKHSGELVYNFKPRVSVVWHALSALIVLKFPQGNWMLIWLVNNLSTAQETNKARWSGENTIRENMEPEKSRFVDGRQK